MDKDINEIMYRFAKIAQDQNELSGWQAVLEEAQTPIPSNVFDKAINYIMQGVLGLVEAGKSLKNTSSEDITEALKVGEQLGFSRGASIDIDKINKFADDFNNMNKTAQMNLLRGLGSGARRVIPIIGFVFSGGMALKNLYYGFIEYKRLIELSGNINLAWYQTLFASYLIDKISEYSETPNKLIELIKVCKSARVFVDEAISFGANSIDFVKDVIFVFIEAIVAAGSTIIPPGWAAVLGIGTVDVGLSIIIGIFEYYTEKAALQKYDYAISNIEMIAQSNIKRLDANNQKEMSYEELLESFKADEPQRNYEDMSYEELTELLSAQS